MLAKQYFIIDIKDNNLMETFENDNETYKNLEQHFEYLYHTKSGETYPLDKDSDRGIDTLIVDGEHFYELLEDMNEQGFYEAEEVN